MDEPEHTFPAARWKTNYPSFRLIARKIKEYTFPVNPEKGTSHLPFFEGVFFKEPLGRSRPEILTTAFNIVIRGQ
jgi:hypothetical protein